MSQSSELPGDGQTPPPPAVDSLPFEEAFRRLGEMAEALEQGGLTLAEATARYQEGVDLVRHCNQLLNEAELKIASLQDTPSPSQAEDVWDQEE